MKNTGKRFGMPGWAWAWLAQIAVMAAVSAAVALSEGASALLRGLMLWGVAPLTGGFTAYRAVGRGLSSYAAWIAPPVVLYIVHLTLWGYVPPVSSALLCALAALVGAAAGDVRLNRK